MILIGETGSGKTTQVPQLIHEMRMEGAGAIAVTQPRRVAAITIALRVASEMNTEIGNIVGYAYSFIVYLLFLNLFTTTNFNRYHEFLKKSQCAK